MKSLVVSQVMMYSNGLLREALLRVPPVNMLDGEKDEHKNKECNIKGSQA